MLPLQATLDYVIDSDENIPEGSDDENLSEEEGDEYSPGARCDSDSEDETVLEDQDGGSTDHDDDSER